MGGGETGVGGQTRWDAGGPYLRQLVVGVLGATAWAKAGFLALLFVLGILSSQHSALLPTEGSPFVLLPR